MADGEKNSKKNVVNKSSLKVNYIFNFISQILTLIVPLITAPYLARLFHESGNGQIAFAETIMTYFLLISNLGFSLYGQREVAKKQSNINERSKVFFEVVILRGFFVILSLLLLFLLNGYAVFGETYKVLIFIYSIQILAVAFDFNFLVQGMEDFKSIALRNVVLKVLTLVCVFAFIRKETDMWLYVLITSLSVLISNMIIFGKVAKFIIKVPFKSLEFKKHFKPSLIIFLPALSATIYGSLDKLMIRYLTDNPDYHNGCYSQALKLNQTILILITVIDSIMVARNSKLFGEGNFEQIKTNISRSEKYVTHIGIPLLVGMAILAWNISSWFFGEGYTEVPILLCIMGTRFITSGLACVYGNQLFISIGKENYTTIAHVCTMFVNLLLNFIFIPWLGAIGGAITTAAAEFIDFLVLFILCWKYKYTSLKNVLAYSVKPLIASCFMGVAVFFINNAMAFSVGSFVLSTVVGMLIYGIIIVVLKDSFALLVIDKFFRPVVNKFKKNK